LLPSFWSGTKLEYKKNIVGIIDKHNGFSPECIMELKETCHILLLQMKSIQVCYELARENPFQLDMLLLLASVITAAQ
jgi:hypothetical protein